MSDQALRIESVVGKVNTWIVGDDEEVVVIDPGADAAEVLKAVGEREIMVVICTHGHAAHVAAAVEVAERDDAEVALHPGDRQAWREVHDDDADIEMEEGGRFTIAGATFEVIHAPGHSKGSVILYCEDLGAAFTGDVVSETGPVPHDDDFPNWGRQLDAIGAQVLTLPSETRLLSGHGGEITVAEADKRFNAWVSTGQDRPVRVDPDDLD
jgi:glyoxylase-like metal-dependent hydrolase (beta-lactamase superfamily II)